MSKEQQSCKSTQVSSMRRDEKGIPVAAAGTAAGTAASASNYDASASTYFTYRPLSNLPTPPPTYKENPSPSAIASSGLSDGEQFNAKYRGPAIHLVNLIPSSASLTTASVPVVQAILSRADLPIETVALAVCILDSLDKTFSRAWRLCCPLVPGAPAQSSATSKRHSLPPAPLLYQHQQHQMLHIDSVPPEIIVVAALVIAVKFTQDPQQLSRYYCDAWGRGIWSYEQLNVTERCIMESLDYRIMPLCDEDCLADAMVDMQLAGQQHEWHARELSPPDSISSSHGDDAGFVAGHKRSRTAIPAATRLAAGPGLLLTPLEERCRATTEVDGTCYF